VFFSALPLTLLGIPLSALFGESAFALAAIGVLAAWAFVVVRSAFSRCPRCRHFFNQSGYAWNPFRRSCGNCELPLWEI
jgi:hypothetical protein